MGRFSGKFIDIRSFTSSIAAEFIMRRNRSLILQYKASLGGTSTKILQFLNGLILADFACQVKIDIPV